MEALRKIDDLSLEQLRDEVWFWRTDAAARLFFRMGEVRDTKVTTKAGWEARRRLSGLIESLSDALAGKYHPECFACLQPIRPGDAVITDVTEGGMHAECPVDGQPSTAKPGDKIFMDPESIVIDEDHPEGGEAREKPDHLVAHAASRLYSEEQIVAKVEAARALLEQAAA